jgi:hypothetical protein
MTLKRSSVLIIQYDMVSNNDTIDMTNPEKWTVEDAIALRVKVEGGRASSTELDFWQRVKSRYQARYWRGNLSKSAARQLGLSE